MSLVNSGLGALGISDFITITGRLADIARDRGFVNVTEKVLRVPIGTWPGNKTLETAGLYWRANFLDGLQAIGLGPLTRGCGWKPEQIEVFLISVRKALLDNSCLLYMPLHIICAQKPENSP
jgi:hypothetical protein